MLSLSNCFFFLVIFLFFSVTYVVMTGLWSVSRPALGMALESLMLHLILDLASVKSICDETSMLFHLYQV